MLANLLSVLEKNADYIWLGALLLALAFRRNRYVLALGALGVPLFAAPGHPGLVLAAAILVLFVAVLPEPPLRSLRSACVCAAALALPFVPDTAPALAMVLDRGAGQVLPFTPALGWTGWIMASAALFALFRWLQRGWPLDLYLALALIPAIVAMSSDPPHSARSWLALCAAALAIAVLYGAFRMAFIDALTGLPNRRALDERLLRSQGKIAVAMVDVDHFKRFNDRYGHEAGDRVLKAVAKQLRHCRGGSAYRYGGEEFSIVFEGRSVEHATESLEAIRESIAALRVRLKGGASDKPAQAVRRGERGGDVGVTVSLGLAERDPQRRSSDAIVDAADKALYRSKQRGRNRLTSAPPARSA